ncbi:MAG: hypothetical protein IJP32_02390, partial [Clostridia bacterium]|nr:hypothetical protein [Clostridia bacterium]
MKKKSGVREYAKYAYSGVTDRSHGGEGALDASKAPSEDRNGLHGSCHEVTEGECVTADLVFCRR